MKLIPLDRRDADLKRCTWCGAWTCSETRNPESTAPICRRCTTESTAPICRRCATAHQPLTLEPQP